MRTRTPNVAPRTTAQRAPAQVAPFGQPIQPMYSVMGTHAPDAAVDISQDPRYAPPAQQHAPAPHTMAPVSINFPQDMSAFFTRTTPEQRVGVLIGLANAIVIKKGVGNKFVNIYDVMKVMRQCFGDVPVEMGLVEDALDTMIYKGVARRFTNSEAQTSDGEQFFAVHYGLSKAGWDMAEGYGITPPEWRVEGAQYNPNANPYAGQADPLASSQPRVNGIRNNMNTERKNKIVSI